MTELENTKCCGVGEINNLSHYTTIPKLLQNLQPRLKEGYNNWGKFKPYGAITFTGVTQRIVGDHASRRLDNYGQAFADYIEANKLGTVTVGASFINWTMNPITLWVWMPDYVALHAHIDSFTPVVDTKDVETLNG